MGHFRSLLCFLVLAGASLGGSMPDQQAPTPGGCTSPPPAPTWTCVNGNWLPPTTPPAPTPPAPPPPTYVISVGETVSGALSPDTFDSAGFHPGVSAVLYELTAPSDGFLTVQLSYDSAFGFADLLLGDGGGSWLPASTATMQVVTGRTYRIWVFGDHYYPTFVSYVLTTSISAEPPVPPPPPPQSSCATPDPFTSLGGGTCFSGDWWPPGLTPPGMNPNPPLPPPPPSSGDCTTPDPFVSLGGGTCFKGDWWPPGLTPPGVNPNPPPPPLLPPPSSGGCTTPDPFVSLGGGTCSNGDWWPPGLTPPGVNPNPPPLPPLPPPSSGGCTTPDPFVSLGGGTCLNGDWWPPGLLPAILSVVIR